MNTEFVITNARIVTPTEVLAGTLVVRDGLIYDISEGISTLASAVDFESDYLLPGLVELHTDHLEQHLHPRPGVRWSLPAGIAAHDAQLAAAGITTVFDALRTAARENRVGMIIDSQPLIDTITQTQQHGLLRAEHFLHLRCEVCDPEVITEFDRYASAELLRLVSVMDHAPGQRQYVSTEAWWRYHRGKYHLSDDELQRLFEREQQNSMQHASPAREHILGVCKQRNIPAASHDDATRDHVEEAAALGVSIAEFPTTLEAAKVAHEYHMSTIAGAPNLVRGGSHSGNIAASELVKHHVLDIMSSDYVPASLMQAAFSLNQHHQLSLPEAVAKVSTNPARIAGLDDRGRLASTQRADMVRVKLHQEIPMVRTAWRAGARII